MKITLYWAKIEGSVKEIFTILIQLKDPKKRAKLKEGIESGQLEREKILSGYQHSGGERKEK